MKSEEITDLTTMRDKRTVESEKALTEALLVLNNLQDIVKQQVLGRDLSLIHISEPTRPY